MDGEGLRKLGEAYVGRGVTSGHWHEVLRTAREASVTHMNALPGLLAGVRQEKGGRGLLSELRLLLEERNRWAHGAGPQNPADAANRVATLLPALEGALVRAKFLAEIPWVLVRSGSYRRVQSVFAVTVGRAMGDHPEFEAQQITSPIPLADDTFYALTPAGPIDLTPFVVIRYCDICQQPEVCHADRLMPEGVALKSFGRGHVIFDPGLEEELRQLGQPPVMPTVGSG